MNTIISVSAASGAGSLAGFITGVSTYATAGLAGAPVALSFVADFFIDKAQEKFSLSDRTAVILKVATMVVLGAATVAATCLLFGPLTAALIAIPLLIKAVYVCVTSYREIQRKDKFNSIVNTLTNLFTLLKSGIESSHESLYNNFTSLDNAVFEAMKGKDPSVVDSVKKTFAQKKEKIAALIKEAQEIQEGLSCIDQVKDIKNEKEVRDLLLVIREELQRYESITKEIKNILKDPGFIEELFKIGTVHPFIRIRKPITEIPVVQITNETEAHEFIKNQLAKTAEFANKFQKTFELLDKQAAENPAIDTCIHLIRAPILAKMSALQVKIDEIKKMTFATFDKEKVANLDKEIQSIYESIYHRVYVDIFKQLGVDMTQAPFPFHEQFANEEKKQANEQAIEVLELV